MKRVILILTIVLFTISCNDETTKNTENELEMIHGFVRTLESSERAGILGDTSLNEFYHDRSLNAQVFPNPSFGNAIELNIDILERDVYQISIIPAIGSNELKAELDSTPGIDISQFPDYSEMIHLVVYQDVLGIGSNALKIESEYLLNGFNFIEIQRMENGETYAGEPTLIPIFVNKDSNE